MNASDITNAIGLSPGIIASITSAGSTNYTATLNVEVTFTTMGSSTFSLTVNGVTITSGSSQNVFSTVTLRVAKGQALTIVASANVQSLVCARSIA